MNGKSMGEKVITWGSAIAILPLLSSAIAPQLSHAQAQIDCNNPQSTTEYTYCAHRAYEEADRRLNQVYQQLTSRLSSDEREELVDAQLVWIEYRDENCEFKVAHTRRGTGHRAFLGQCLEQMTRQRTAELESFLRDRF
jgi:uncharacterized protein YecT (DUF1311 family)